MIKPAWLVVRETVEHVASMINEGVATRRAVPWHDADGRLISGALWRWAVPDSIQTAMSGDGIVHATVQVRVDTNQLDGSVSFYAPREGWPGGAPVDRKRFRVCDGTRCDAIEHTPGFGAPTTCVICLSEI
jgi:hypothetical protein